MMQPRFGLRLAEWFFAMLAFSCMGSATDLNANPTNLASFQNDGASTPALVLRQQLRGKAARPPASDERRRRILQAAPAPTATPAPTRTKSTNTTGRPTPRPTPPPWEIRNHDRGYRTKSRSPATSFVLVLVLLIIIVCVVRFLMFGLVLFGGCCSCCCNRSARKDLNRGSVVIPVTQ